MKYIFGIIFSLVLVSCSSSNKSTRAHQDPNKLLTNTATVPAAQGRVNTRVDANGNTNLQISVKHLANPSSIQPGANGYVVWIQPIGQDHFHNVGTLRVNRNLEGNYQTNVPYKNFRLLITPESNTMAQRPTGVTVMEKSVSL